MPDKKWISLRHAVIKISNPSDIKTPEEIDYEEKPLVAEFDQEQIDQFVLAAIRGKICARGWFAKISVRASTIITQKKNRKDLVDSLLNCTWKKDSSHQNSKAKAQHNRKLKAPINTPFIVGYEIEKEILPIKAASWQRDGQVWMRDMLIDFNFDFNSDQSKLLHAQPWSESSLLCLDYKRPIDWDRWGLEFPEFHAFFDVELEALSLNQWLLDHSKIKIAVDGAANNASSSNSPASNRGRNENREWGDINELIDLFIQRGFTASCHKVFYDWLCKELGCGLNSAST